MTQSNTHLSRRNVVKGLGVAAVAGGLSTGTAGAVHQTWRAHLRPIEGIDPSSNGQGNFELKRMGDKMRFGLQAANLTSSALMAHIHHPKDGAPVVWLYSGINNAGNADNVIQRGDGNAFAADGSFTAGDLVGEFEDKTLDDLVSAIEDGEALVRVHTEQNLAGEIQGTLW